ncbi:MAG: hypothetical protein HWE21_01125 [Cytophagia bacterium]|nr:hypothetical protein [Cytophagia bacterium]
MQKNKVTTYLLFAFGEIILVMIGILLALEVNNWNEQQQKREFESRSLVEIYNSLKSDSARISQWIMPRLNNKKKGINAIGQLLEDRMNYPGDSVFMQAYYLFDERMQVSINYGPFEALKGNGLDKISSPEVRYWLIDLYESLFPRQIDFIKLNIEATEPVIQDAQRALFRPVAFKGESGNYDTYTLPKSKNILTEELFIELFRAEQRRAEELDRRTRTMMEAIQKSLAFLRGYFQEQGIEFEIKTVKEVGIRGLLQDSTSLTNR